MRSPTTSTTPARARRGLTLVELLVTVALMLMIMSIIVAVFTVVTDAMKTARDDQELANVAQRLDAMIRQDLGGATARFTPPLNPQDNLGYFEYGENSPADAQGEDTDDYVALTAKAPPGQPFSGRVMLPQGFFPAGTARAGQVRYLPTTITSDYAEIVYFVRNNNLYRRVLLVVPDRVKSLAIDPYDGNGDSVPDFLGNFDTNGDGVADVSWQGANDVSARPSSGTGLAPVPNSLGDLTNRHNRIFRPGFVDDYLDTSTPPNASPDGQADDVNLNGVPDLYPTLYSNLPTYSSITSANAPTYAFVNDPSYGAVATAFSGAGVPLNHDMLAFPFVFPGMYSHPPQAASVTSTVLGPGSIHNGPLVGDDTPGYTGTIAYNHSPLDVGDTLPIPTVAAENYTWWGFPTWAETRSVNWTAATERLNYSMFYPPGQQSYGLSWQRGIVGGTPDLLPPQRNVLSMLSQGPWYTDLAGNATLSVTGTSVWQDDLVATNVRSFDVKAYEPHVHYYSTFTGISYGTNYYDLGYAGSAARTSTVSGEEVTFGHEGRIPPLTTDNRVDFQFPSWGIGDNSTSTVRLRRVWDSWSTDYAYAPHSPINPFEAGPYAGTGYYARPIYPSYPPPYPSPLRGIQIQLRIASPDGNRLKVLTIRQDFSDKL